MSRCADPGSEQLLPAYELGMLSDADRERFEIHLTECEVCFQKVQKLEDAAQLMRDDPLVRDRAHIIAGQETAAVAGARGAEPKIPRERRYWPRLMPVVVAGAAALLLLLLKPWDIRIETGKEAVAKRKMLAVLPFENLGAPEEEYFADGITDEITARLAAVCDLGIISRTSAMKYKKTEKATHVIGQELGVDYLLEGTIRWDRTSDTDRVRITPQLIRVSDDTHLWADIYERSLTQIFAVQADIAAQIVKALDVTLLEPERQVVDAKPTENLNAYNAYLRGRDYMGRPDPIEDKFRMAVQMFELAVELDPDFALAYTRLSLAHSQLYHHGYDRTERRLSEARRAADRALALQPALPEAHLALGYYYYKCLREYDAALEAFAIAERGLPNDASIFSAVGWIRRRQGRLQEASENLKRAFQLNPRAAGLASEIGSTDVFLRKYGEAERFFDRSISLVPDQELVYTYQVWTHWLRRGDAQTTRAILESMPKHDADLSHWTWLLQDLYERRYQAALDRLATTPDESIELTWGFFPKAQSEGLVYHLMGETARARAAFDSARILLEAEIEKRPDDHRVHSSLGIVYAGLGRTDAAIREGQLGVELFPVARDALIGPSRIQDLALIYTMVGEYDAAIDQIEYLLSIPSWFSVALLRLDPVWDPLRDHPRFQELLERGDVVFGGEV